MVFLGIFLFLPSLHQPGSPIQNPISLPSQAAAMLPANRSSRNAFRFPVFFPIFLPMKSKSFSRYLPSFFLLLSGTSLFAQSPARVEQQLLEHLKKINAWAETRQTGTPVDVEDSIENENMLVGDLLQKLTAEVPSSIRYGFDKLSRGGLIDITESKDGLFRIYSWDIQSGGTVPSYNRVYQYRTGDKVYSILSTENTGEFVNMYTLNANNKRYYLATSTSKVSTSAIYESIQVFTVENGTLSDTASKIIRTRSGLTNSLSFEYSIDDPHIDDATMKYDESAKTIQLSVVVDGGRITKRKIVYKFIGTCFERIRN